MTTHDEERRRRILERAASRKVSGGGTLSALGASVPQYASLQLKGVEGAGDILGLNTSKINSLINEQEAKLSGFKPKYPERLAKTDSPVGWWKEKASLNAMNTVAPMLGFAVGSTLQAIPNSYAKLLGKAINYATFASTYNANLGDTLEEHRQLAGRELSQGEKAKAAIVAVGVSYLDVLSPLKVGKGASSAISKSFGKGGVDNARKSLEKLVNTTRDSALTQLKKGAVFTGKVAGIEAGTEGAQKALQIGTSVQPGRLATSEGLQDIMEEAIIAGPTAAIASSPVSVGVGREQTRDISNARRLAAGFNEQEKARVGMQAIQTGTKGELGVNEEADLINIPDGKGYSSFLSNITTTINDSIEAKTDFNTKKFFTDIGRTVAAKAPSVIKAARDKQTNGHDFARLNDILQMFISPGNSSSETKIRNSFFQEKDTASGQILENTSALLDQLSKHKFFGLGGRSLDPDVNTYLRSRLQGASRQEAEAVLRKAKGTVSAKELDVLHNAAGVFREDLNRAYNLMKKAGMKVGFIKNYLHNPMSANEIKKDREGFIDALVKASEEESLASGGKSKKIDRKLAEQITRELVEGRDPSIIESRYLREDKDDATSRDGVNRRDFEKSRSNVWARLPDKYREKDLGVVLEQYLQRAGTRIASAKTFGPKNADRLTKHIRELVKNKAITTDEANRIWDMYDASHNVYKKSTSEAGERFRKFSKLGTTVGAITHLGLATFSSLPELVWTAERAGLVNTLKSIPDAWNFASRGFTRGLKGKKPERSEGAKALARLGFNLNPEVNERLDQLFSTDRSAILSGYFRSPFGSFLTQWTNFNRNLAVQAGTRMLNEHANNWDALGTIRQERFLRELKEQGLVKSDWLQITEAARGPDGVVAIDILNDKLLDTVITKKIKTLGKGAQEVQIREVLMPWVHKIVEDVVIQPNAANKPLWMSNPDWAMVAQLKTFPIVFGNTVVKRLLRKLNPKQCSPDFGLALSVVGAIAAAYAVAFIGEQMKAAIRQTDPKELGIVSGANVIGLTGAFSLLGGARYGDLSTSMFGPALDSIINKGIGETLAPIVEEGNVFEGLGNLTELLGDGILQSFGPIGLNIQGGLKE